VSAEAFAARAAEDDRDFADTRLREQVATCHLAQIGVDGAGAACGSRIFENGLRLS